MALCVRVCARVNDGDCLRARKNDCMSMCVVVREYEYMREREREWVCLKERISVCE